MRALVKPKSSSLTDDYPPRESAEESDDYTMRVYQLMIENDENNAKSKTRGPKGKQKRGPKGVAKSPEKEESVKRTKVSDELTVNNSTDEELNELRKENKRLKQMVDQYLKESHNIINKASLLKEKDKTTVMQTLELMKFNAYLISHLPDSEAILDKYLAKNPGNGVINCQPIASTSSTKQNGISSASKPFKSPVNQISNYFRRTDKTNGSHKSCPSDSESEDESILTSKITKEKSSRAETTPKRVSPRKAQNSRAESTSRRVSPRKRTLSQESGAESGSENVRKNLVASSRANSSDRSKSNKNEEKKKKETTDKPKRRRRPRVEEPKGLFPCTFDPRQCDEIMDTKEHFDFHMSGHYDAKYVCPFCAYTGPTIQIIKRHLNKERDTAIQDAKDGKYLNADRRAHKDIKIYQCFGCKVCHKIHYKFDKKCEHIEEEKENQCTFMHDMDYEFKDHLRDIHFRETFKNIKDKEVRKQKIKTLVDKFVEELYFENNAKKGLLVEKFNRAMDKKDKEDSAQEKEPKTHTPKKASPKKKKVCDSSDSDWD